MKTCLFWLIVFLGYAAIGVLASILSIPRNTLLWFALLVPLDLAWYLIVLSFFPRQKPFWH